MRGSTTSVAVALGATTLGIIVLSRTTGWVANNRAPRRASEAPISRVGGAGSIRDLANVDVGDRLCVPGVDFSTAERTLIVALSDSCGFCLRNEAFFGLLGKTASEKGIPVYALAAAAPNLGQRLSEHIGMLPVESSAVGFYRLPAVALVDQKGVIRSLRTGLVKPHDGLPAVAALFSEHTNNTSGFTSVTEAQARARSASGPGIQFVDPRGHEQSARSPLSYLSDMTTYTIPAGEIAVRSPYELRHDRPVVVDCRHIGGLRCQEAMAGLLALGFPDVSGLDLPKRGASPSCGADLHRRETHSPEDWGER